MLMDGPATGSGLPRLCANAARKEKRPLPNPRASDVEEYCNYNQEEPSTPAGRLPERWERLANRLWISPDQAGRDDTNAEGVGFEPTRSLRS